MAQTPSKDKVDPAAGATRVTGGAGGTVLPPAHTGPDHVDMTIGQMRVPGGAAGATVEPTKPARGSTKDSGRVRSPGTRLNF